jgi:biopolymer transport protein ExbB
MMALILQNPLCWLMLLLALLSYQLLLQDALLLRRGQIAHCGQWHSVTSVLIASLPLCGLLGTIIGLLSVFANLSQAVGDSLADGIGQALFTTQLGLTCAIPAWLLQSSLHSRLRKQRISIQGASCSNV